jgi:hypothetical protein
MRSTVPLAREGDDTDVGIWQRCGVPEEREAGVQERSGLGGTWFSVVMQGRREGKGLTRSITRLQLDLICHQLAIWHLPPPSTLNKYSTCKGEKAPTTPRSKLVYLALQKFLCGGLSRPQTCEVEYEEFGSWLMAVVA